MLAAAGAQRRAAAEQERHVTAQVAAAAPSAARLSPTDHSASAATSAAAASALPPASPPLTGMPLRKVTLTDGVVPASSATARTARTARLSSSSGTPSVFSPTAVTVGPPPSVAATVTSSYRLTAWKTVRSSWKPSARSGPTPRCRLIFAGTRTVTLSGATSHLRSYGGRPRRSGRSQ